MCCYPRRVSGVRILLERVLFMYDLTKSTNSFFFLALWSPLFPKEGSLLLITYMYNAHAWHTPRFAENRDRGGW